MPSVHWVVRSVLHFIWHASDYKHVANLNIIAVTCMLHAAQDQSDWWSIFQKVIHWLTSGAWMGRVALGQGFLRALRFSPVGVVLPMLHTNHRRYVVFQSTASLYIASLYKRKGKAFCCHVSFNAWYDNSELGVHRATCPRHKSVDPLVHQVIKFSWYISLHLLSSAFYSRYYGRYWYLF
jgi:hypothetical protein